ncbi:DNA alkylation repair protein [Paenibacillus oceani]|uniref:DNA alkylation repair protein n=1 Tax=Paenibacillus oceani TaxID=2772510 RepID=A0A927C4F4_9BACL|nr:DNA alkylation repair protein [Paenibacillus oceani]MBD2861148.1 DNA alkylation repair protein [Paenibacillus oceani]
MKNRRLAGLNNADTKLEGATLLERKGARKAGDIPEQVIELLNRGQLETVNLTEWLAVDHTALLQHVLAELGLVRDQDMMRDGLEQVVDKKIMKLIPALAKEWLGLMERLPEEEAGRIFGLLSTHRSDSVRCWAAYMIGLDRKLSLEHQLAGIRPFAADHHFGVREIAWMAVREPITRDLSQALRLLNDWVHDEDAHIRRFAIEATRPQGVWAKHIAELKVNPGIALSLLEAVQSDPVKYVQDSVGNWLNDAGKSNPDWVIRICSDWLEVSDTKATKRIVARAQRSFAGNPKKRSE